MSHTMLLADDSVTTHRIMELTFAQEDIRVLSVADGEQAVERMRTTRPDILVAEVALPRVDGYKLSEHVRSTPALAGVPVLLLTGAFDVVDELRVRASGAAGIIVKPFEPEVVINRVKELLGISDREPQTVGGRLVTPPEPPSPESASAHRAVASAPAADQRTSAVAAVEDEADTRTGTLSFVEEFAQESSVRRRSDNAESASSGAESYRNLDEAFGSLDQQFSAGAANRPGPHQPTASGAAMGPLPRPSSSEAPVFEIDQEWFDGNLAARSSASKPASTPFIPDVAETFQALLAAEQGQAPVLVSHEPMVLSDEVIERIATRVAERLSEGVLVETVRNVVETVAERLVREEIARIRAKAEVQQTRTR